MKKILLTILGFACFAASAQISGNQAYSENNNSYYNNRQNREPKKSITVNGDQFTVSTQILMNVRPDMLVVTLGISQEAKSVEECSEMIEKRIDGFMKAIRPLGIKEADVYVDFISQTRIYDYNVDDYKATQFEDGFELKKNIIIRLGDTKAIHRLTGIASGFDIYDVIKAEYINKDTDLLYARLFDEAVKSIESKKQKYMKTFRVSLSDEFTSLHDSYYSVQPSTQYREYSAFETAEVVPVGRGEQYVRKLARKAKTFYYQGEDTSSFDKVINPSDPEVCLQYVVEMEIVYHLKK